MHKDRIAARNRAPVCRDTQNAAPTDPKTRLLVIRDSSLGFPGRLVACVCLRVVKDT